MSKEQTSETSSIFPQIKETLYRIIFGVDTFGGRAFDVALIFLILFSIVCVMLDSVEAINIKYGKPLYILEWIFTILFTIEYLVRLYCSREPLRYAFSFLGLVDLLAVIPTYVSLLIAGAQYLFVIRIIRLLRIFRILKLVEHLSEANILTRALFNSRYKISVFIYSVLTLVVILGSLMYVIEGAENGFTSIPKGVYWAIVTLTTVGYGDLAPQTPLGQFLASVVMIMGYGIIAVPTGIVTAEITYAAHESHKSHIICKACGATNHDADASFCRLCGTSL